MANHNQVAHAWAHKTGKHKKGFSVFYDGDTIFSWGSHFPIARHVTDAHGNACILFTSRDYSSSTSKHKTYVRRAIPHGIPVYCVLDVTAGYSSHADTNKRLHGENYASMVEERESLLKKASRARKYKAMHLRDAEAMRASINAYLDAFGLDFDPIEASPDIEAELNRLADEEKRIRAEQAARDKEAIKEWLAGGDKCAPHTSIPYVRVKDDTVQTSWGVTVPLKRALAIYRLASHCRNCGHEYTPRKEQTIGSWRIDRIASDGTLRAGCHVIPWRVQHEAAQLAKLAR